MGIETITGKDYITQRNIGWGERGLNVFVGLFTVKGLTKVDDVAKTGKKQLALEMRLLRERVVLYKTNMQKQVFGKG